MPQQGGAMASMIAALQAAGLALTDVPPLRFVMLFGSVPMTHPRYEQVCVGLNLQDAVI